MMGCSNQHPHGQIWAQVSVPEQVLIRSKTQEDYAHERHGASLLGAYLEQEIDNGQRLIYVDEHFVALVPWWAVWPFEVLLAPRRSMQDITSLSNVEAVAFAKTLAEVTQRYDRLFNTAFPYSAGIYQAPVDGQSYEYWHWHMEFKPPLLRSATVKKFMVGYELFAMPQRDLSPEKAAELLRTA
jgi:UDPglucose--hexose-1-phosphate uridylyltransferase